MTPTLTDADRAKIDAIPAVSVTEANARTCYSAGYEDGLAAGRAAERERCAKVCENRTCGSPYPLYLEGQLAACKACAAAIRERAKGG